jgi:hypothetical protein
MPETFVDLEPTARPVERPRELLEGATSAHGLRAAQAGLSGRWRDVDQTIEQSIGALSAPRLHRSP